MTNYVQMEMRPTSLEHPHGEMFELKSKQDDSNATHSGEFNHSQQDTERTNQRAFNAERLVEKVREVEQSQGKMNTSSPANNHSVQMIPQDDSERKLHEKLKLELASKEQQIAALLADKEKMQSKLIQIDELENLLSEKEELIGQLKFKLENQADYEEIKKELNNIKSNDPFSTNRSIDDQNGNRSDKCLDSFLVEKSRPLHGEQPSVKTLSSDPECQQSMSAQSCRRCSSPCLNRTNPPCIPVSSLLASSSASSSSNAASSPPSPSLIYPKTQSFSIHSQDSDDIKLVSSLTSTSLTNKDNSQLSNKFTSIPSSCSTMVTPTASLLSSVSTATTTITPSNLFGGPHISSVQCTKLHCPPTSSGSPPLSSSVDFSTTATTSKDNINTVTRTVIKPSKQPSPKSSPSPTVHVQPACTSILANNPSLEPLDTAYVADVVRKLLAQHNIGQRIFARYILSLSQGTVSELLSKPKSWSKLTEKGKESYRKMWLWANSEESILKLKSISPRKGMNNRAKDNPYPNTPIKSTDPLAQQKIVQILADAQKQQFSNSTQNQDQKSSLSPCSSLPNEISQANLLSNSYESKAYSSQTPSSSPSSTPNSSNSSAANSPIHESALNDHPSFLLPVQPPPVPQPPTSSSNPSSVSMFPFVPSLLMRASNGFHESTENYRNWLMLQEIFRHSDPLKQFKPNLPPIPTVKIENSEQDNRDDEDENDDDENDEDQNEHHSHFEHEPSQSINGNDDDEENEHATEDEDHESDDEDDAASQNNNEETPLDLSMKVDSAQSDTETASLTFVNQKHSSIPKNTKTALPPLREQDTSKYRCINTNELVQTVKDILSRYSISQRHFGEKILGLSQGSVSDILARPKSWELLTQKGREPFLRMRIFLDDPNAITQLVQTVSTNPSGAPTSLLGSTYCSSFGSSSIISSPSLLSNPLLNGFHPNNSLLRDSPNESQSVSLLNDNSHLTASGNLAVPQTSSSPILSNGLSSSSNKSKSRSKTSKLTQNDKSSVLPLQSAPKNPAMAPYELPKITLPPTIDTEQLSSQVRELLFNYSIGQRVFGEAVLNLSQGTVSEILSKPRAWHSLSVKGRDPYIRMYTWFNDPGNVQKLLAWKRDRDALRRSRPPVSTPSTTNSPPTMANLIMNDIGDVNNSHGNSFNNNSSATQSRPKRRSLYTDKQRRILRQAFNIDPYPSQETLDQLVNELSLPLARISNWFHNARMRAKNMVRSSTSPIINFTSSPLNNNDNVVNEQSEEEDEYVDNNNNPNNEDQDDDDDDEYGNMDSSRPTIVPLGSSWLNEVNDSNSSAASPTAISANAVYINNEPKLAAVPSMSSSSSKKRKSVPQKLITTNNITKKFNNGSTIIENDNYNTSSNDESASINQTTNETTGYLDILS